MKLIPFLKNLETEQISLTSEIYQNDNEIILSFRLKQNHSIIDFGDYTPLKKRVIGLWEKTCFEFFIKNCENEEYIEFNFSPNFSWNCFYFAKKGDSLQEFNSMLNLEIDILNSLNDFQIYCKIPKKYFPKSFQFKKNALNVGLSSVLLTKNGEKQYWALTHKDIRPNFHHFESFICKF